MQKNVRSFNYPVRDRMLVENGCTRETRRAVRYAIFTVYHVPTGLSEQIGFHYFYQYFVPNGTFKLHYLCFLNDSKNNKLQIFYTLRYGDMCAKQALHGGHSQ
jgi:hypothetical protein